MQVEKWQLGHLEQTLQNLFGFKQKILIEQPVMQACFYTGFCFNSGNFFMYIYKTRKTCLTSFPNAEKRVKNMTHTHTFEICVSSIFKTRLRINCKYLC